MWQVASEAIMAVAVAVRHVAKGCFAGWWRVAFLHVAGRSAVNFERERRTTLRDLSAAVSPGTEIYDRRADGSVLTVRIDPCACNRTNGEYPPKLGSTGAPADTYRIQPSIALRTEE